MQAWGTAWGRIVGRRAFRGLSMLLAASLLAPFACQAEAPSAPGQNEEHPVPGLRITAAGLNQFTEVMRARDMRDTKTLYTTEVEKVLGDVDPNRPLDIMGRDVEVRNAVVKLYQKGGFEAVKAMAKEGTIKSTEGALHSETIAAVRNAMVHETLTVMSSRFGEVRVNDFSTAPTAQSDIDQTFHPSKVVDPVTGKEFPARHPDTGEILTGEILKAEFNRTYEKLFGIDPERMECSSHAKEAEIPDWRKTPVIDDFAVRLKTGAELLMHNPEAYFLEGAFRRQVDRRSYESDVPLFRIYKATRRMRSVARIIKVRPTVDVDHRLARVEVYNNVPPEWRKGYAFGAAVGNLWFFAHHNRPEEVAERAKYLMRSMEDGMGSLALEDGKPGELYYKLDADGQKKMLRKVYPDADGARLDHLYTMYKTAWEIRENRNNMGDPAVKQRVMHEAMLGFLKENNRLESHAEAEAKLAQMDGATREKLMLDAGAWFQNQSRALMVENITRSATARIDDWIKPEEIDPKKLPKEYREVFQQDPERFKKNLQEAARIEILYAFAHLDPDVVEKIVKAEPDPARRAEIESLRDLAELKRSLIGDHYGGFFGHARAQAHAIGRVLSRTSAEFATIWRDGDYSAPEKYTRMKELAMSKLGYYRQGDIDHLEAAASKAEGWDVKAISGHVFNLGNLDSVITIIRAGQDSNWSWKSVGWAAGFEVISNLKGVSPFLAVKGALCDGEFQGAAVLVAGYFVPAVGQVYMVYNIANGAIMVVDFEISRGISDMVYQGYTPAESSGFWGFIRAVNPATYITSIASATAMHQAPTVLYFVPGDTFAAQRCNMFGFFDPRIMRNVDTTGMDEDDLFKTRERLAPAHFRQVVNQYCEQKGEFADVFIPGGSKFREYLARPDVRDGLIERCVKDYLAGGAAHGAEEFQRQELPQLEKEADEAATLMTRCEEGLAALGATAREYLPIASGMPDFPELTDAQIDAMKPFVEVDKESAPIIKIKRPDGIMTAGSLWQLRGECYAPLGRFYPPYDFKWTVQGLSEEKESQEPQEGLTLSEGWTEEKSVKVKLVVTDVMGTEIGNAETVIAFGKGTEETSGKLGEFTLMRVDVTYYSAKGKKKGQNLDKRVDSFWIPMMVTLERTAEKARAELIETIKDCLTLNDPGISTNWRNHLDQGYDSVRAGWAIEPERVAFPTPFKLTDVPERRDVQTPGGGPVW